MSASVGFDVKGISASTTYGAAWSNELSNARTETTNKGDSMSKDWSSPRRGRRRAPTIGLGITPPIEEYKPPVIKCSACGSFHSVTACPKVMEQFWKKLPPKG